MRGGVFKESNSYESCFTVIISVCDLIKHCSLFKDSEWCRVCVYRPTAQLGTHCSVLPDVSLSSSSSLWTETEIKRGWRRESGRPYTCTLRTHTLTPPYQLQTQTTNYLEHHCIWLVYFRLVRETERKRFVDIFYYNPKVFLVRLQKQGEHKIKK